MITQGLTAAWLMICSSGPLDGISRVPLRGLMWIPVCTDTALLTSRTIVSDSSRFDTLPLIPL